MLQLLEKTSRGPDGFGIWTLEYHFRSNSENMPTIHHSFCDHEEQGFATNETE